MDKRSWPWKRKTSEKAAAGTDLENAYVKISAESHAYLIGLEDQVKSLEDQVKSLNEKLYSAQSEIITKDDLVKQHAKVAEDAVAGWEKAEAEAAALKHHLESVTLQKLTAEERASHFDDALKECMKQIQIERKENEQKIQDVVFAKTKQWERIKFDLEAKIAGLEQDILRASAENVDLERSLQDSSDALFKAGEAKSQAESEIQFLKAKMQSYEKEVSSLTYELQIISKEVEIRNEEKNMSVRVAEAANKQHLEDVKKTTKLEAECQRLRGLLRKKLPGPATIAQMKLEVDSMGLDHAENKVRRSSMKISSPRHGSESDYSFHNSQQLHRENEFLTSRLLTMEEEMKMLKEALSNRNNELLATRELYAKAASKLQKIEGNSLVARNKKNNSQSNVVSFHEQLSIHSPPSLTSISEDGFDEECSYSESCASTSEHLQFKKGYDATKSTKDDASNHLELMNDFLEVEKFASLPSSKNTRINSSVHPEKDNIREEQVFDIPLQKRNILISEFESRIASLLESQALDGNIRKILEDIRHVMQVRQEELPQNYRPAISEELRNAITKINHSIFALNYSDTHKQAENMEILTKSLEKVLNSEINLCDYILALSRCVSENQKLGDKVEDHAGDDFIDKVTLLEKKIGDKVVEEDLLKPDSDQKIIQAKWSLEQFEQVQEENEKKKIELSHYREALDRANLCLVETKTHLEELKSKLAASEKSNSLVETQLKCMVESYKSLESRSQELGNEIMELRVSAANLEKELQEERFAHQEDLAKYKDLLEQIESRNRRCSRCASESDADAEIKRKQELEIAAAAEKLAECQETITLLGRQLKSMRPSEEFVSPSPSGRHRISDILQNDGSDSELMVNSRRMHGSEINKFASVPENRGGGENLSGSNDMSSSELGASPNSCSSNSSKHHKQRSRSSSTTSFSRFFSKGKTEI